MIRWLHALLIGGAVVAALAGQQWIRTRAPVGLTMPPPAPEPPVASLPEASLEGIGPPSAWAEIAAELGDNAVGIVLDGTAPGPAWRIAIATADPAFAQAVAAEGRDLPPLPAGDDPLDLPGLPAYRTDAGAVGWRGAVGEVTAGDPDALAGLLIALDGPPLQAAGALIAASLLPGWQSTRQVLVSDVYSMEGWTRGPKIGAEYSLVVRRGEQEAQEVRFEATTEGGRLYR
ncbi:MAG: hypothetical protein ACI8PZ_005946 [Myxococcota bacterium]